MRMRTFRLLVIVVCFAGLTACSTAAPTADHIQAFWQWFQSHQKELSAMQDGSAPIFNDLALNIKGIDESLVFEIGPVLDGKKELAISANANPDLFPLVEQVVAAAPPIEKWKIVAFRQRTPPEILKVLKINVQSEGGSKTSVGVAVKDLRYRLSRIDNKASVVIFIKDFSGQEPQKEMAYMMLQQAIGEYDLVMKVGDLQFESLTLQNTKTTKPFEEIGSDFDKLFSCKS